MLFLIYITGDMHGRTERIYDRRLNRLKKGDTLIICGDFGFIWNGSQKEKKILDYLGSRRYNVAFIDGTHENYDLLSKYRMTVWKGGRVHRISGNHFHMMRGQIFTIEGLKIFTFGGGESLDREIRTEHESWWREEFPSSAEMAEGAENIDENGCRVDYIITHEPPSLVKSSLLLRNAEADRVNKLNGYLEQLDRECEFRHWFFGSMHEDRTVTKYHTAVFKDIIPLDDDAIIGAPLPERTDKNSDGYYIGTDAFLPVRKINKPAKYSENTAEKTKNDIPAGSLDDTDAENEQDPDKKHRETSAGQSGNKTADQNSKAPDIQNVRTAENENGNDNPDTEFDADRIVDEVLSSIKDNSDYDSAKEEQNDTEHTSDQEILNN